MKRLVLILGVMLAACGGDDDPFADADPRCAALCTIVEPDVEGAGDICSMASAGSCLDQCAVRIADTENLCANCLLEGASFGAEGDVQPGDDCFNGTCTTSGHAGTCSYPQGDDAARAACIRQVNPRREVACEVDFEPVSSCSDVCGGGGA
jgi:hypothetical protein